MRRTKERFKIDASMPDSVKPAWVEVRNGFRTLRRVRADLADQWRKLVGDRDLTDDARDRKLKAIGQQLLQVAEAAHASLQKVIADTQRGIEESVERARSIDAMPKLPDGLDASSRAVAERLEIVGRALARAEADRILDRALARERDGDGTALLAAYRALGQAASDPLVRQAFETYGLERVRAEGSLGQVALLHDEITRTRDARLPEAALLLLDHRDALGEAWSMAEAAMGDARAPERFLGGENAPGLNAAEAYLGPQLAGVED